MKDQTTMTDNSLSAIAGDQRAENADPQAKITHEELVSMFGTEMPWEAVALIWDAPEDQTLGQVRARLREIAAAPKPPTLLSRLRREAVNWSATCGDLFDEAADEIERLWAIEQAAQKWRASLEDDGWTEGDILSGICRNGMADLMRLLRGENGATKP